MSKNENLIITPDSHLAFERSIEMLSDSLREIRQVAMQMVPETIMLHGLDASLRAYIEQVQKPEGLRIVYESFGMKDVVLEPARAAAIFHVIQELVSNTIRHADAEKLVIMISNRNGRVWVNVEDNGHGFDTAILRQQRGTGWSQILHSMDEMQGKIETQSAPGRGTSVRLVFNDK